jgi:GNAT superfamily N-acetyltransferase
MTKPLDPVTIRVFRPEDLDWVVDRHVALYRQEQGFDHTFRSYVERPVKRFGMACNPDRENLWIAEAYGDRVGTIAIVFVDDATAQLRWYLLEPEMRGRGIGGMLMQTAIDFCTKAGYKRIILWTVSQLDVARHIYQVYGFNKTTTEEHEIWGRHQKEERWERTIG